MMEPQGFRWKKLLFNPRKVFFGWWMTIAGGLLSIWGYGYSAYGFSALLKPISDELGFSRTAASFAASIARFEGGLEAPVVGYLSDRYGPRMTVLLGIFLAGLGLVLMYWIQSLWSFYLVWSVILCTGTNISLSMPLDVAIANWFIRKRGTALSVKWVFSGMSGVIGLPIVAWLVVNYGWRMACLTGGIVMWVFGLPLVWLFIKPHRPEYYGLLPDGSHLTEEDREDMIKAGQRYAEEAGEAEFTPREALRTRSFWLLIAAYMFHGALYPVMSIHCVPFLTDRGMDPLVAATTMSIFVAASIPARFIGGFIVDRIRTDWIRFLMAGSYFIQFIGVMLFLLDQQSMISLYTFFILYGLGMGASFTLTPAIRARYFGRRFFGTIAGISHAIIMPVGVMGPVLAGYIFDRTGSYLIAFVLFAVLLGTSSVIMGFAAPPKQPERPPLPVQGGLTANEEFQ